MRTGVHYLTLKIRRPMATAKRDPLSRPSLVRASSNRGFVVSLASTSRNASSLPGRPKQPLHPHERESNSLSTWSNTISHVIYLGEISFSPVSLSFSLPRSHYFFSLRVPFFPRFSIFSFLFSFILYLSFSFLVNSFF